MPSGTHAAPFRADNKYLPVNADRELFCRAMVTAEHIKAASERFKEYVKGIVNPDEDLDEPPHDRKLVDVGTAMSEIESSEDHEDSASDTQSRCVPFPIHALFTPEADYWHEDRVWLCYTKPVGLTQ